MFWYIDPTYMYVFFITLIISVGVQLYLKSSFSKWSNVANGSHVTGIDAAKTIFSATSLQAIPVEAISGSMTDHFDPRSNIVRLSDPVRKQPSIASMAIAAHELGHVQQYQTGSAMIKARGFLVPALRFSPTVSYICLLLGFWFNFVGLIWLGIAFFGIMVVFSVLTIPVEFDASRRGLKLLEESGLMITDEDRQGARSILRAAGMTYLAAAVTSIIQLLYYISVANRRR
jgi:Zn-dependent membrane protease YugP